MVVCVELAKPVNEMSFARFHADKFRRQFAKGHAPLVGKGFWELGWNEPRGAQIFARRTHFPLASAVALWVSFTDHQNELTLRHVSALSICAFAPNEFEPNTARSHHRLT